MKKFKFLSVICMVTILSGINFCGTQVVDMVKNDCICVKVQNIILINHQICDNGFNPNKRKKC